MKILTVPDQRLRQKSKKVKRIDKKLIKFLTEFEATLANKQDPPGVGLAAPQVGKLWRIFATQLVDDPIERNYQPLEIFINPQITKHSDDRVLGSDEKNMDLEGCLSIPELYGPVPRWSWIDLEYQILEDEQLISKQRHFVDFNARIIQHEYDHLDGILFTDYIKEYDLPLYHGKGRGKLTELKDKSIIEAY